jgi:DNA-binding Lrp family transcriptional regulator
MSHKDLDLVFLYAENARAKIKDLANTLKKSPQRVKYSMRVLEEEGIIRNLHCIFDYSYLGLLLFRVYFKGGYISEKDRSAIIKKLGQNNYIVTMSEMGGGFDLVIEFVAPNPSRFNKELKKVAELIPSLDNYSITLNIVTHIYPRYYLTKKSFVSVPQEIIVGGDRAVTEFSENEMSIIKSLLVNPKLRLSGLAKSSGLNVKTVTSVIKSLRKKKILKGVKYTVNNSMLGIHHFRLFLKLHNISQEREEMLLDHCLRTSEILQLNKTVGDWDIEIDIASFDKARIRELTADMREKFKDLIETFNIIEVYQYYRKNYLPLYLWEEIPAVGSQPSGKTSESKQKPKKSQHLNIGDTTVQ